MIKKNDEEMVIRGIETRLRQPNCNLKSKWISSKLTRIGKNWIEYTLVKRVILHPQSEICRILCKGEKSSDILRDREERRMKATETRLQNTDIKNQLGQAYMDFRSKKITIGQLITKIDKITNRK